MGTTTKAGSVGAMIAAGFAAVAVGASLGLGALAAAPAGASPPAASTTPATSAPAETGAPAAGAAATAPGALPSAVSRQWLDNALSRRQAALARLSTAVAKSAVLPTAVRTTLHAQLATETSGIDALASAAASEPAATLAGTAATMVERYRVYLVMVPKVRISVAAGRQQRAERRGDRIESVVAARIATAQGSGRTVAKAVAANQDLVQQIATAVSGTNGAGSVLAVQPSGYPADAGTIAAARRSLASARSVVAAVRADLRDIRSSLEGS